MNNNVVFFPRRFAAPAPTVERRDRAIRNSGFRPPVSCVWRVNPANHRLECRWTTSRAADTAEGVSCGVVALLAA